MLPVYMNTSLAAAASCGVILTECISSFSYGMKLSDVCFILFLSKDVLRLLFLTLLQLSHMKLSPQNTYIWELFASLDFTFVFCIGVFKHYNIFFLHFCPSETIH